MTDHPNTRLTVRLLLVALFVVAAIALGLAFRNLGLKKAFGKVQKAGYVYEAEELVEIARKSDPDVKVVLTGPEGLWDKDGSHRRIELVGELTIGEAEGDTNKMFYRGGLVVADTASNIYVGENNGILRKFDRNGNHLWTIGRKGKGPGEFLGPLDLGFNNRNELCAYDGGNRRLSRFSTDGQYLGSISFNNAGFPFGFVVDTDGLIYLSAYNPGKEKVIHHYSPEGKLLNSFGEPVLFKEPILHFNKNLKFNISGGRITLANNVLYFSQKNPYEIRKYTTDGRLLMRIFRKNDFMSPARVKITDNGVYHYEPPPMSVFLSVWGDYLINWAAIPIYSTTKMDMDGVFDIFDLNGNLLTSLKMPAWIRPYSMDAQGKIYGMNKDEEEVSRVVRCALNFKQERR